MGYQMNPPSAEALRQMALQRLGRHSTPDSTALTSEQMHKRLEEMAICKIEVEIQNEYLQEACGRLDVALSEASDLYDGAPVASISTDAAGNIKKLNLAAARMLGQERHLLLSRSFADFLLPQQREHLQGLMRKVSNSGEVQQCDMQLLAGNEQVQAVHLIVSPLATGKGHLLVLTETSPQETAADNVPAERSVDSNQHLRTQEDLLHTKAILQALLESLPQYVAVLDSESKVIQTNALWNTYSLSTGHAYRNGFDRADYADLIDGVTGGAPATNRAVLAGVADVISGKAPSFQLEYVFQTGHEKRWFVMQVMAVREGRARAVVSHMELSRFKTELVQRVTRSARHRAA